MSDGNVRLGYRCDSGASVSRVSNGAHSNGKTLAAQLELFHRTGSVEVCDTSVGIQKVWARAKSPNIPSATGILEIYTQHAIAKGYTQTKIEKGQALIAQTYTYASDAYTETARNDPLKTFRKDGVTPRFAHPVRCAKVMAHLGADAEDIAALILHDVVEDCGLADATLARVKELFGTRISKLVALDTRVKMEKTEDGHTWISIANNPEKWEIMKDQFREEYYEERYRLGFSGILNSTAPGITPDLKVKAFVLKWIDAIDSVVTDGHLESYKRDLRIEVLRSESRFLLKVAPELYGILYKLLATRGIAIDDPAILERSEGKVMELPPITPKNFNRAYLERFPVPNGKILLYSDSLAIKRKLELGIHRASIRIELPHNTPNAIDEISKFFDKPGLDGIEFTPGRSLAPYASNGAGTIVWVSGIRNLIGFNIFKGHLMRFHDHIERLMDGSGTMA